MPTKHRKRQIRRLRRLVKRGSATKEQEQRLKRWTEPTNPPKSNK